MLEFVKRMNRTPDKWDIEDNAKILFLVLDKTYVVISHSNRISETFLMMDHNMYF